MIENKEVMARNIKKQMDKKGVSSADVCRALNFKTNTFSNWINAKIYPRIDKIEMMANYFGISKSELVEDQTTIHYDSALVNRALQYYKQIQNLSPEQRKSLEDYLSFLQSGSVPPD